VYDVALKSLPSALRFAPKQHCASNVRAKNSKIAPCRDASTLAGSAIERWVKSRNDVKVIPHMGPIHDAAGADPGGRLLTKLGCLRDSPTPFPCA
jgi:hypothetical protein